MTHSLRRIRQARMTDSEREAETAQVDIGEFVEMVIQREVIRRVHEANAIHERTARLGITGIGRESRGT